MRLASVFIPVLLCVASLGVASLGVTVGCARQPYVARPLDAQAAAAAYAQRRTDDPLLKEFMVAQGHSPADWPVRRWRLSELTLLAFHYRPELEVARTQARAARAQAQLAAQRAPLTVSPVVEHHSEPGAEDTPWSLGFEVQIPLIAEARRQALVEQADYLAQAAELAVGAAAWRVRSEVRLRLLDVYAGRQRTASLDAEAQQQRVALELLERRLQAGYASITEVDTARLRLAQAEADVAGARTELERALGGLAEAVSIPLARMREIELAFGDLELLPDPPDPANAQAIALRNRVDLRRTLLEFAAADAAVKLEVARQYPAFTLRPGYLWDQGDNVWSLALDLVLPASLTHGPAIRAAEARREAAAQQVLQQQGSVIGDLSTRLATYLQAREGAQRAAEAHLTQIERNAQVQRRFDIGQVDRLDLTLARIETILTQRRAQSGQLDAQRTLGALEDALQMPLVGGPLPRIPQPSGAAEGPAR
jgi:outer membrane protein TolC